MTATATESARPRPPADLNSLACLAQALFAGDKGLLAIDESIPTSNSNTPCCNEHSPIGSRDAACTLRHYRRPGNEGPAPYHPARIAPRSDGLEHEH